MSFKIDSYSFFETKLVRITNTSTLEHIDISTKGGFLNSWTLSQETGHFDIIDGNNLQDHWKHYESNGFKGAKMNPFCCRLQNGKYNHNNNAYSIDKFYLGAHALHGIIYDAPFEITQTERKEDSASVTLYYEYQQFDKGFPFKYSIEIKWTYTNENKIIVHTKIKNLENQSIPMMDGWHPYFKLADTIDESTIQFFDNGMLIYDKQLLPTGQLSHQQTFENPTKLAGIILDNGFLLDMNKPSCKLENNKYLLMVTPDGQYPYLQLYTPENRKSIAIENMSAAPNCFNNKMGLQILQPQSVWLLTTTYQLFYK